MLTEITSVLLEATTNIAFNKIKNIEEKPVVCFSVIKGSYKIINCEDKEDILVKLTLLFKNTGKSTTSVTDLITCIKYTEEILNNKEISTVYVNQNLFVRSKRLENNPIPIEIGPGVAKQVEFNFKFQNVCSLYIDRASLPVNFSQFCEMRENKVKWIEWTYKLPIIIHIVGDTLTQKIKIIDYLYKEDQEESKEIRGSLDYEIIK